MLVSCGKVAKLEIEYNPDLFSFENGKVYYKEKPYSGIMYKMHTSRPEEFPKNLLAADKGWETFYCQSWTSEIVNGVWSNISLKWRGVDVLAWNFGGLRKKEELDDKEAVLRIDKKMTSNAIDKQFVDFSFTLIERNSNDSIINSSILAEASTRRFDKIENHLYGGVIGDKTNHFKEGFTTSILSPENYLIEWSPNIGKYGVSKNTPKTFGKDFFSWAIYDENSSPILTLGQIADEEREKDRIKKLANCERFVRLRVAEKGIIQTIIQENFPNYTYIVLNTEHLKNYVYKVIVNDNCDDILSSDVSPYN